MSAVKREPGSPHRAQLVAIRGDLEAQLDDLYLELASRKAKPLRMGFLGIRGACKSSLLASWYMFGRDGLAARGADKPTNGELRLDLRPDERSMAKLKEVANDIKRNGTATATAEARPEVVRFTLRVGDERVELETLDFSGYFLSLLQPGDELKGLAEEARKFIRSCDVVLCLINWNDDALETSDALDVCFRTVERPPAFIVGLTRFDEVWPIPLTKDEQEATIRECLVRNRSLAKVQQRISDFFAGQGENVAMMLIAPLGGNFAAPDPPRGKHPPLEREDLQPYNIHGPLLHAFAIRRQALERLDREIAATQRKIADLDAELNRLQENDRQRRLARLRGRIKAIAAQDHTPGADQVWQQELSAVAAEAQALGDDALADQAKQVRHDAASQLQATRRAQLKNRLHVLLHETEQGGFLRVLAWMHDLRAIQEEARQLNDDDLAGDAAAAIRRLTPQALFARLAVIVGGKSAEILVILAVIVLALAGAALCAYFVDLAVGP